MADYKQSTVSGNSWTRCHTVAVSNQYGSAPSVSYREESLLDVDGKTIRLSVGEVGGPVDLSAEIAILDQTTLEPTGQTVPIAVVYAALFSDYIARARARDAAAQPTPDPTPNP